MFQLTNQTDTPLTIQHIDGFGICSCQMHVADGQMTVLPGDSAALQVDLPTHNVNGKLNGRFIVSTDCADEKSRKVEFRVSANVLIPIRASPGVVGFGTVDVGSNEVRELIVESDIYDLAKGFRYASSNSLHFVVEPWEFSSQQLRFNVQLHDNGRTGAHRARLQLHFDLPDKCRMLNVDANARVAGPIVVVPSSLNVPLDGHQHALKLRIRARDGAPLRIDSVKSPDGISIDWSPVNGSLNAWDFACRIDSSHKPSVSEYITVMTDRDEQPVVSIPIYPLGIPVEQGDR